MDQLNSDTLNRRKMDPWSSIIPMDLLVLVQLDAISTTPKIPPFKLITVGRSLLGYMIEAKAEFKIGPTGTGAEIGSSYPVHANIPKAMGILDKLFQRIGNEEFEFGSQDSKNMEHFCEEVWKSHLHGILDFTSTSIVSNLLQRYPQFVEPILGEAIQTGNCDTLTSLCYRHRDSTSHQPKSFQLIFNMLSSLFEATNHHPRVIDFTRRFTDKIQQRIQGNTAQIYPVQFQPILQFLHPLQHIQPLASASALIHHEILLLINGLYEDSESNPKARKLTTFFLASNPTLMDIIQGATSKGELTSDNYPYFWKYLYK